GKNTDAVVLDLAGTKAEILKAVAKVMPGGNYISGHPMAGNEKTGLAGAEKGKFKKAAFVLIPHRGTRKVWLERITQLIRKLGARPIIMKAEEHDRLIALTSHLPYALALGLMNLAGKKGMRNKHFDDLVGGSFRGATRVVQSPTDLTLDMFLTNKSNVTSAIDGLIDELKTLKKYVRTGNDRELRKIINKSKVNRSKL
ncbi:MAG: prephenate dehydrogenase, partial [FCB group bacterium]|nr:prephenate dehydrogenase [FCB group bacterium]